MGNKATSHFVSRCLERLPGVKPHALANDLIRAIECGSDYVEHVMDLDKEDHLGIYRFAVQDGRKMYAMVDRKRRLAVTVLTQDMLRKYKDVKRGRAGSIAHAVRMRST